MSPGIQLRTRSSDPGVRRGLALLWAPLLCASCGDAGVAPRVGGGSAGVEAPTGDAVDPCPADIQLVYSPLLPLRGEDASLTVTVADPDGVAAVSVDLTAWPVAGGGLERAMAPAPGTERTRALRCTAASPPGAAARSFTCPAPLSALVDGPMIVRVGVRVEDGCGVHQPTERWWELAAGLTGDAHGGVRWGAPGLEGVPIPVLRRPGDPAARIDMGFVDTSARFPGDRLAGTRALLSSGLYEQFFGSQALYSGRELWSFYLLPGPGDCAQGEQHDPSWGSGVDAGIDIRLALCPDLAGSVSHLPPAADTGEALSAIYLEGAGSSIQAQVRYSPDAPVEGWASRAIRHELGHAAFYLSDEYGRVNGGRIFDTSGPEGAGCAADPAPWFNNLIGLDACRWYWRCFQGAEGACEAGPWEPEGAPRLVESGERCVMAQTHSLGPDDTADFGHSCSRRAWRVYEVMTDSAPLSLVCQYGGRAAGCAPIEDCTRRARLGATLSETSPPPGALDSLHIQFRGGLPVAAGRRVLRGYARTLPIAGRAAALVAYRGDRELASAALGAFWLAHLEAGRDSALIPREDFELAATLPLSDPSRPPDRYEILPLGADGARGAPLVRLRVDSMGEVELSPPGPLPPSI